MAIDTDAVRVIITGYEMVPYGSLELHPQNARESDMDALQESIENNGFYDPVVVQVSRRRIIKGNHRYIKMGELGAPLIPTIWAECDDATALRILLADNRLNDLGGYDPLKLAGLLEMVNATDTGLIGTGYDQAEMDALFESLKNAALGGGDDSGADGADGPAPDSAPPAAPAKLADRFIVPPFSILDARQGYWQERKKAWLALGIQSEIGRGNNLGRFSDAATLGYKKLAARTFGQDLMRGESSQGRDYKMGKKPGERLPQPNGLFISNHSGNDPEYYKKKTAIEAKLGRKISNEEFERDHYLGATTALSGTSIFDPVICELAYRWFCPPDGIVVDPFAGGSVRGIVAAKLGRQYHGIDLRAEQVAANQDQAQRICQGSQIAALPLDVQPDMTPIEWHGGYPVKREDRWRLNGVNGSKVRAMAQLLAGQPGVVAFGSRHSPHCNRIAHVCQRLGIPFRAHIASGELPPEMLSAQAAGGEIIQHNPGYMNVIRKRARDDAQARGWYLVPFGLICEETAEDAAGQVANLPADIQRLVCCVGSGITLAGVIRGLQRAGRGDLPILGVCVGSSPQETLDTYAPGWRDQVTLQQSALEYETPAPQCHLGEMILDPIYEAKCLPYLQAGDCLWIVGIRQTAETQQGMPADRCPMPQWYTGDSAQMDSILPADLQADFLFTCPPYFDLEKYSDHPSDLSAADSYAEFLAAYRQIIAAGVQRLRPNRFAAIVVGDIRDGQGMYRNFVSDTIQAFIDAGASYYNEAILVTAVGSLAIRAGKTFANYRKLGKSHQNVLVFIKGDPQAAVADCGEISVELPADMLDGASADDALDAE